MIRCLSLFLLLLAFARPALSQVNFTGSWKGTLTQDAGGFRSNYRFELYLVQKGNQLTGRSYVSVENIHATLEITGEVIDGKQVRFKETRFVNASDLQNMEWCYKSGVLQLKKWGGSLKLEGTWAGVTSFGKCIPGKIYLTLQRPQA